MGIVCAFILALDWDRAVGQKPCTSPSRCSSALTIDDVPHIPEWIARVVAKLRRSPPAFMTRVLGPLRREVGSPLVWLLDVEISGAALEYATAFALRLSFSHGKVSVRFLTPIQHIDVSEDGLVKFGQQVPCQQGSDRILERLLRTVREALSRPRRRSEAKLWQSFANRQSMFTDVARRYTLQRLHPELFDTTDGWSRFLDPRLEQAVARLRASTPRVPHPVCQRCVASFPDAQPSIAKDEALKGIFAGIIREVASGVYAFHVFNPQFCEMLLDELDHFYASGLKSSRPNSMNRYGAVLDEFGMGAAIAQFQRKFLAPLSRLLFPGIGDELDSHHAFAVHYSRSPRGDEDLPPHRDDSEVTFNVALGRGWEGSRLEFCGLMQEPDVHQHRLSHTFQVGSAVLHLGRHVHAAEAISAGERTNLVIWSRSWAWRKRGGDSVFGEQPPLPPADSRCIPRPITHATASKHASLSD